MKKERLVLLCAFFLLLSACARVEFAPPEGAYPVYFAVSGQQGGTQAVDFEYRTLEDGEGVARGLITCLLSGPQTAGLASPFLSGVRLNSVELREDGQLQVDFSEQYNGLPGVYLTVANACLVLTLGQIEGVESVSITVEGKALPYQALQPLHVSDFLLPGAGEETVNVEVLLYFPRKDGKGRSSESHVILKNGEKDLLAAVLTARMEGPAGSDLVNGIPTGTVLRSVSVEDGLCTVNFSEEFLKNAPTDTQQADLLLASLVETLCGLEEGNIQAVQFQAEGAAVTEYGGRSISGPLEPEDNQTVDNV